MLIIKRQKTFADDMVYSVIVDKEHLLYKVNELMDFSFVNKEMAEFYHDKLGRIAVEPEVLIRAMVAQYLYNWSDRVCADMVNNHIVVKWFVGLSLEEKGFDFTLLSKYRKFLREKEKHRMVFDAVIERLIEDGYISKKEKIIMDATHLVADVAIPTTTRLIRDGIEMTLEAIADEDKELKEEVVKELELERYLKEEEKKEYLLDKEEKTERLARIARDAWQLKEWLKKSKETGAWNSERIKKALNLLEKILEDYVEEDHPDEPPAPKKKRGRNRKGSMKKEKKPGGNKFKERKKKGSGRIVSLEDPDARWGAKSDAKTFAGYKAHNTETENQLILDVEVTSGNVSDDYPVLRTVDRIEEKYKIKIEKITGDTKYGTGKIREKMAEKGAQVVAPLMPATNTKGFYTNDKFNYDETSDRVTCPSGGVSERKARDNDSRCFVHFFPAILCNSCPKKNISTESDNGRAVSVSDFRQLFSAAAQYNSTPAYKEDMKLRSHIEPKQWEMKHPHGLNRVRYRGLDKVQQQALNVAAVINLKRFVSLRAAEAEGGNAPKNRKYAKVANN